MNCEASAQRSSCYPLRKYALGPAALAGSASRAPQAVFRIVRSATRADAQHGKKQLCIGTRLFRACGRTPRVKTARKNTGLVWHSRLGCVLRGAARVFGREALCQGTDSSVPLSCRQQTTPLCRRHARSETERTEQTLSAALTYTRRRPAASTPGAVS
jgi:hypothetical protein